MRVKYAMASEMALELINLPKPALYTEGNGTTVKDMARYGRI